MQIDKVIFYWNLFATDGLDERWKYFCSIIPDLTPNTDLPQDPVYHPEGSCNKHIMLVLKNVMDYAYKGNFKSVNDVLLYGLVALFHDIGKAECHTEKLREDGTIKYQHIGHEYASCRIMNKYKDLFTLLDVDYDLVHNIVHDHMKTHLYNSFKLKKPAKREAFEKLPHFNHLILFAQFDSMGKIPIEIDQQSTLVSSEQIQHNEV